MNKRHTATLLTEVQTMNTNKRIKELILNNLETILNPNYKNDDANETIIVYDGIVSKDKFGGILFLLKEAVENSIKDDHEDKILKVNKTIKSFDLIHTAFEEALAQSSETYSQNLHWKELCEWIYAYKNPNDSFSSVKQHGRFLSEIAIVNIKKVAGLSTTKTKILNEIIKNEKYNNLLRQEIDLIKPKIVICCGTFEQAKNLYHTQSPMKQLNSGVEYFKHNNILFIDFIHPTQYGAAQKPTMKYAFAKEVFGELSKRENEL